MILYLNEDIIKEGLSKTIYHFTTLQNLLEIMNTDNMYLQSGLRSGGSDSKSNSKLFYLCFTRVSDGRFGYSRNRNVRIEFDGDRLSYNYSGKPIDYWGETMGKQYYFKNAQEDNKIIDYTQPYTENEDRLFSKEPVIRDVSKYINRIDVLVNENNEQEMAIAYKLCHKDNIFIYNNQKDFNAKNQNTINLSLQANFDKYSNASIKPKYHNSKRVTEECVTDAVNFILYWECNNDDLKKNAALLLKQYGLEKYTSYVVKNIGKNWFMADVIDSFTRISDKMLSDGIKEDYVLTMQMLRDYCLKHNITDRYSAFKYKKSLENKLIQNDYSHRYYDQFDYDKTLTTLAYITPHNNDLRINENGITKHLYGVTLILHPEKDSVWDIEYLKDNVKYSFESGDISYYVNSHKSKNDEYFQKYLKHLSMNNNFTVNEFIKFVKNVDMDEETKNDWLLCGGRFETITVECSNCVGKYPDCLFISNEERKEVEQYFLKLNENKQQKKVYINEDKLQLLKEDYYDISQIKHNDEFYTWQDWDTFPFFYTHKGEIIVGDEATTHDDWEYEDYFNTDFSKGFGRIFITNEKDIIIVVSALSYDDKLTDIETKHIVSKVLDKFKCDSDKVYYIDPYGNDKELKKYSISHANPKQRNLGNMTLAQYHSLIYQENKQSKKVYITEDKLRILQENISSVVYHFTDFNSFAKIATTNELKMSRTNAYAEAENEVDKNNVNNEINGKYNYYISFTRSPNSKLGYSQWFNDNPEEFGSPISDGIVRIEIDGDMFNQRKDKKAVPMDFFSTQFRNATPKFKAEKALNDKVIIPKNNKNTSSKETQLNSIDHFKDEIESRQNDMWYDDTQDKKALKKHTHPTYVQNEDRFMTNTPDRVEGKDGYITDFSKYVTRVDIFLHNDSEENQMILNDLLNHSQLGKEGKIHVKTDMKSFDRFKKDENMRITENYRQLYLPIQ